MKIRSANVADEAAVTALWRDCGLTVPYNDPSVDFRFALGKPNSDVLVTEDLSGAVMVGHDGHRGWLYYLAVAPARQRQGLGRTSGHRGGTVADRSAVFAKVQLMVRETNHCGGGVLPAAGF